MSKDKTFISAVVYLHNDADAAADFVQMLYHQFTELFANFEIIAVDDFSTDQSLTKLRAVSSAFSHPLTIIRMSRYQGKEPSMNAGLDMAIGDYIYQFESVRNQFDSSLIQKAFEEMHGKCDVLSVAPPKKAAFSTLFYQIFQGGSSGSTEIGKECFSIVSRRAVNRVHAINEYVPYRKYAFAAAGLPYQRIIAEGAKVCGHRTGFSVAIESVLLYTKFGYKLSIFITVMMLCLAVSELFYTVAVYCMGRPVEGWTTLALFLTFGLAGLFLIMSIMIRYLSLLLEIVFRNQQYLIRDVEIIQK